MAMTEAKVAVQALLKQITFGLSGNDDRFDFEPLRSGFCLAQLMNIHKAGGAFLLQANHI